MLNCVLFFTVYTVIALRENSILDFDSLIFERAQVRLADIELADKYSKTLTEANAYSYKTFDKFTNSCRTTKSNRNLWFRYITNASARNRARWRHVELSASCPSLFDQGKERCFYCNSGQLDCEAIALCEPSLCTSASPER